MTEIKFALETVTPLFLGGANPRGQPELRAASMRGALRFWLRALLGGVIGDSDLNALRDAESAVFGSTKGASPVVVRIQKGSFQTQPFSQLARNQVGVSYLFFAARKTRQEPERKAIIPGCSFELTLSPRAGLNVAVEPALRRAYAALWLLTRLGGLGARSRRGGGSLQARQVRAAFNDLPSLVVDANNCAELRNELANGLRRLRQLVRSDSDAEPSNPSVFDVLHPHVCNVWVIDKGFRTWQEALDAMGQFLLSFRRERAGAEFPSLVKAAAAQISELPIIERASLGLPIAFYDPAARRPVGTLEGIDHDRRASPLLIRATKVGEQYVNTLTLFRSLLLPPGERLALRKTSEPKRTLAKGRPPSWNWLRNQLLRELGEQVGELMEVTGW